MSEEVKNPKLCEHLNCRGWCADIYFDHNGRQILNKFRCSEARAKENLCGSTMKHFKRRLS